MTKDQLYGESTKIAEELKLARHTANLKAETILREIEIFEQGDQ